MPRKSAPPKPTADQVFDEIIALMQTLEQLRASSRNRLMRKLEAAYVVTAIDPDDKQADGLLGHTCLTLNQLDLLDGVRLYLHTQCGAAYRSNTELDRLQPGEL